MEVLRSFIKSVLNLFNYDKPKTIVLKKRDDRLDKDNLARIYLKID